MSFHRRPLTRKTLQSQLTAKEFDEKQEALEKREEKPSLRPSTTKDLNRAWKWWQEYCLHRNLEHPLEALANASPDTFVLYLEWRYRKSQYENLQRSSVNNYWKNISALFKHKVSRRGTSDQARTKVNEALQNGGHLVRLFNLDTTVHDVDSVSIDDFVELLSTLWRSSMDQFLVPTERVRAQLWLFEHIAGYTGTRPGAILDGKGNDTSSDVSDEFDTVYTNEGLLRYKHCKLTLFPSADGAEAGHWVLEISLLNTKGGSKAGKKPVTYLLHTSPCLALCPLMSFFTMAFADKAFLVEELNSPTLLPKLKVLPGQNSLTLAFKPSILDTPIFRDKEGNALSYSAMRTLLLRLGFAAGYRYNMTTYCMRRGFANAIHGNTTTSIQNQAMTHNRIAIYEKYYQNSLLQHDVQNTFIGLPSDDKLIKLASSMRRHQDMRRPVKPNDGDRRKARSSEHVRAYRTSRLQARLRCNELYGSLKAAIGSREHTEHQKWRYKEQNARHAATLKALRDRRAEHDQFVLIDDVRRQLVEPESESPAEQVRTSEFLHPIRERVATALFVTDAPQFRTMQDEIRRASVLTDLVDLYRLKEPVGAAALNDSTSELMVAGSLIPQDLPDEEQNHDLEESEDTSRDQCYAPVRARRTGTVANPVCVNCAADKSSSWYRDDSDYVCRACYVYHRDKGKTRPQNLIERQRRRPRGPNRCCNPHCGVEQSTNWRHSNIGTLCGACAQYYRNNQSLRPQKLVQRGRDRRGQSRKAQCRRKITGRCSNPSCTIEAAGQNSSTVGFLCWTCSSYYRKYLSHRPQELVQRARDRYDQFGRSQCRTETIDLCSNPSCAFEGTGRQVLNFGFLCEKCARYQYKNKALRPNRLQELHYEVYQNFQELHKPQQSQMPQPFEHPEGLQEFTLGQDSHDLQKLQPVQEVKGFHQSTSQYPRIQELHVSRPAIAIHLDATFNGESWPSPAPVSGSQAWTDTQRFDEGSSISASDFMNPLLGESYTWLLASDVALMECIRGADDGESTYIDGSKGLEEAQMMDWYADGISLAEWTSSTSLDNDGDLFRRFDYELDLWQNLDPGALRELAQIES